MFEMQQAKPINEANELCKESLSHKATLGSALVMGGLIATTPIFSANNERPIANYVSMEQIADDVNNQFNPRPDDYNLKNVGKINLFYLDKIKSCDSEVAKNVVAASIIHDFTTDKSAYLATLNKIGEYFKNHPEYVYLNIKSQRENPEYNKLYKQYEIESDKITHVYNSILKSSPTDINERLDLINITDEDREHINNAPKLVAAIESIRQEILTHISSEEYLKMLQIEFNCSLEEARGHQKTRLENAEIINYIFSSTKYLEAEGMPPLGFFCTNTNIITIPRNVNFDAPQDGAEKEEDVSFSVFKQIVRHEFWHAVTNSEVGISRPAKELLTITRNQLQSADALFNIEYYGRPAERYVHLKMLETEMHKLGIWSKGEVFSRECSDKMLDAYVNDEFAFSNSYTFIYSTILANNATGFNNLLDYEHLYEVFAPIFNSIADSKIQETYYPPEWWDVLGKKA